MSRDARQTAAAPARKGLVGQLGDFLDDRTGYRALVHEALYERVPGGARWRYVWGSTLVFAFMTQLITGLFLWASYSASAQTAWESVYYIQHEMAGGWLLRGIHHFMAQAMVVLLALHLLQVVIDGAYRAPREVNFWLGLVLMLLVLGMALTGYLLPWDQKGYWATIVATNLAGIVPFAGPSLQQLVIGGSEYGHHTLTRFFALHAGFLPGALILMLVVHLSLFRKHGLHAKQPITKPDAMFWPDQVLKDAVAMLAVMAVVLGVILMPALRAMLAGEAVVPGELGAELGAPADPSLPYAAARPEWYFLFLFQFLKVFEGWGATGEFFGAIVVPGLIMTVMFLMPILGNWRLGHRFNVAFTLAVLAGVGLLTSLALNEDYYALWVDKASLAEAEKLHDQTGGDPEKLAAALDNDTAKVAAMTNQWKKLERVRHSQAFLEASRQAKADAARAIELAGRPEKIPPAGMLELVRHDPKSQGPRLFAQHCASCHAHVDPLTVDAEAVIAKSSAANLYAFGSASWMQGLLDPAQVAGPPTSATRPTRTATWSTSCKTISPTRPRGRRPTSPPWSPRWRPRRARRRRRTSSALSTLSASSTGAANSWRATIAAAAAITSATTAPPLAPLPTSPAGAAASGSWASSPIRHTSSFTATTTIACRVSARRPKGRFRRSPVSRSG